MRKNPGTALLGLMLVFLLCVPALAQTTGIEVDGKVYTFTGGEGTYKADGKTFIIGTESVTIQEAGKPDHVLNLAHAGDTDVVQDDSAVFIERSAEASTVWAEEDGVITEYAQSSYVLEDAGGVDAARFAPYAKFGLSYDAVNNALYYQGQRVRIFEDSYPLEDQACAALEHVDDQGTMDVKTQRDLPHFVYNADGSRDPGGTLTGLYVLTDAEFAARDLRDWIEPKPQSTAVSGEELTPAEKEALYAPYAAFGLAYDAETDALTYQGKRVRQFMDIRKSNGEPMESGRFQGVLTCIGGADGEIDVRTIRDFTRPDASGEGALTGMISQRVR